MTHCELLAAVLAEDDRLAESEREAFTDMLYRIEEQDGELTPRQLEWVQNAARRLEIDETKASPATTARDIPPGRAVPLPDVLRVLPKSPPRKRVG